ncbi:NYN domain-containing protein [Mesorhizobium sp. ZC-5]|uniref:NYN domain-containing protein n=1 Tax=Mesorhizobium sp. ZC-5 TaxID=2986066 RepID=UPI0021E8E56A|nr:NYN domain-containing protein [Mesorhizobium sp. ZC-5]MCV3243289.1 NYN domain-containing protein [Mesorhizobium sp. ZC-5]
MQGNDDSPEEGELPIGDRRKRIAVLIDADNIAAKSIGRVFAELVKYGDAVVKRAYGDFNGPQGSIWEEALARHAIVPHHQFSYGRGKNAADIALVIDAMDLLHAGGLDAFSIVSADSDFMPLATRIREQVDCYVFGHAQTPERFRRSATRFVYIENLKFDSHSTTTNPALKPLCAPAEALPLIKQVMASLQSSPADWVDVDLLERELEHRFNDFDPRTFGFVRLCDLLIALERRLVVDQSHGQSYRVRLKVKNNRLKGKATTSTGNVAEPVDQEK